MAKTYIGVNNTAKEVKKIYVGVNGVAKEVTKAYVGVNGVAKKIYENIGRNYLVKNGNYYNELSSGFIKYYKDDPSVLTLNDGFINISVPSSRTTTLITPYIDISNYTTINFDMAGTTSSSAGNSTNVYLAIDSSTERSTTRTGYDLIESSIVTGNYTNQLCYIPIGNHSAARKIYTYNLTDPESRNDYRISLWYFRYGEYQLYNLWFE